MLLFVFGTLTFVNDGRVIEIIKI